MAVEAIEIHRAGDLVEIDLAERELPHQESVEIRRAVARHLEAHRGAVAAMRELAFERAAQVVDFFVVDEQVAVARDAELVAAEHFHAGEQLGDELLHDAGQQHEALVAVFFGQRDDARQRTRRLHDGEAGVAAEGVLAGEAHDEIQALVLDARETGAPGRAPSGDSTGSTSRSKYCSSHCAVAVVPVARASSSMPWWRKRRQQHVVEAGVLRVRPGCGCGRGSPAAAR